jgi:hypothetical protein
VERSLNAVFVYEVVARIVGIYLCVDCSRKLRQGLFERKIGPLSGGNGSN